MRRTERRTGPALGATRRTPSVELRIDDEEAARDLSSRRLSSLLVWFLPPAAMVSTGLAGVTEPVLTAVWSVGFLVMGLACVRNALRCGRVHCWFTGPLFLLASLGSLLLGTGVLPFGEAGWNWLGLGAAAGGVGLYYLPEMIFGRYFGRAS